MSKLSVNYMGISLKNPVIVGSSNLVNNSDMLRKLQDAGAAAIVYKSLFEEQIQLESIQFQDEMELYNERNAEMISLFPGMEHAGPEEHLSKLREAKALLDIPLIASLNCVFNETWVEYAKLIEKTGNVRQVLMAWNSTSSRCPVILIPKQSRSKMNRWPLLKKSVKAYPYR